MMQCIFVCKDCKDIYFPRKFSYFFVLLFLVLFIIGGEIMHGSMKDTFTLDYKKIHKIQ